MDGMVHLLSSWLFS